jgi:hypothetical protein
MWPYPLHYRTAFASSAIPYPLPHQRPLRFAFPLGEQRAYHVPLVYLCGLGSTSTPVTLRLRQMTVDHLSLVTHLLVQAFTPLAEVFQQLTLVLTDDAYSGSHLLTIPHNPSPLTTSLLVVATSAYASVTFLAE